MLIDIDKKVIRGIRHAVDARGEDWRYPNGMFDGGRNYEPNNGPYYENGLLCHADSDWTDNGGGCRNLLPNGDPACIIGFCAVDQGLSTNRSSDAISDASRWGVSLVVERAMRAAQRAQDNGYVWGVAWDRFVAQLLDGDVTQEEIDAALNEGDAK